MSTVDKAAWQSGWTADDPPPIAFVHVPADAGSWSPSNRAGVERRDLGLNEATDGKMDVQHLRSAGGPADSGKWVAHDLDFQFLYVLRGELTLETEDGEQTLAVGGAACLPPLTRHRWGARSDDLEAVEITAPATFETVVGRDAPLPPRAAQLDPARAARITDDSDDNYVMGAGPRKFFRYRDLGARAVTDDRFHIHIVRATGQPGAGTGWHYHTMAQWFMILGGDSDIRVEDGPRTHLSTGDTMCIGAGPQMRHNVAPFSGDYAVLEMCVPAEYDTLAVDAPEGAAE
jgi:quercetin dioxygenase-like cupin family protein